VNKIFLICVPEFLSSSYWNSCISYFSLYTSIVPQQAAKAKESNKTKVNEHITILFWLLELSSVPLTLCHHFCCFVLLSHQNDNGNGNKGKKRKAASVSDVCMALILQIHQS